MNGKKEPRAKYQVQTEHAEHARASGYEGCQERAHRHPRSYGHARADPHHKHRWTKYHFCRRAKIAQEKLVLVARQTLFFRIPRPACKQPQNQCSFQVGLDQHGDSLWIGGRNSYSQDVVLPFCRSICGRFPIRVPHPQIQTPSVVQPFSSCCEQMPMKNLFPKWTTTSLTCCYG